EAVARLPRPARTLRHAADDRSLFGKRDATAGLTAPTETYIVCSPIDRLYMPSRDGELVPGTLEMLALKTLSLDTMHGYAIAQHIQRLSGDVLRVEEGSLYPALQRMLAKGWVTA